MTWRRRLWFTWYLSMLVRRLRVARSWGELWRIGVVRWFVRLVVLGAVALVLWLAGVIQSSARAVGAGQLWQKPGSWCQRHSLSCNLGTNFVASATLLALSAIVYVAVRRTMILRQQRRSVIATPGRGLGNGGSRYVTHLTATRSVVGSVIDTLRHTRVQRPVVLSGETGSGKSSALREIARELARERARVIRISVEGRSSTVDLDELAHDAFVHEIEALRAGRGQGSRLWHELHGRGVFVVVVDGLDDLRARTALEREQNTQRVLRAAMRSELQFVVALRPDLVPRGLDLAVHRLDSIGPTDAKDYVEHRIRTARTSRTAYKPDALPPAVASLITAGFLNRPVYLHALSELVVEQEDYVTELDEAVKRHQRTANSTTSNRATRVRVRILLLDRWTALRLDRLGTVDQRALIVLERLAAAFLVRGSSALAMNDVVDAAARLPDVPTPSERSLALQLGLHAGFLDAGETTEDVVISFTNPILTSAFASRALTTSEALRGPLLEGEVTPDIGLAFAFAAARQPDGSLSRGLCRSVLAAVPLAQPKHRLALANVAADIANATDHEAFDVRIIEHITEATPHAPIRDRRQAVARLSEMDHGSAACAMWRIANDNDYPTRLKAARALMQQGSQAFDALRRAGVVGKALASESPTHPAARQFQVLAWIVPSWLTLASAQHCDELQEILDVFQGKMRDRSLDLSSEASLAQGYRFAADNARGNLARIIDYVESALDEHVGTMRFWYSRVVLVHALATIAAGDSPEGDRERALTLLDRLIRDAKEHPFVLRAAELVLRGLPDKGGRNVDPYLWRDESAVIRGREETLHDQTRELVADIVLALNLAEQPRHAMLTTVTQMDRGRNTRALPLCLIGKHRMQLFEGCLGGTVGCDQYLCPYPQEHDATARGEFGAAFCNDMRRLSSGFSRTILRHDRPSWQRGSRDLRKFWGRMEARSQGLQDEQ